VATAGDAPRPASHSGWRESNECTSYEPFAGGLGADQPDNAIPTPV
jgi:hypothetical protein